VIERKCSTLVGILLGALILSCVPLQRAAAQETQTDSKTPYTIPEYNAFQACRTEKDPATQVKCLDDFSAKYPNSFLLQYAYQIYIQAYYTQKNYPKTVEYADKLAALDKIEPNVKLQALQTHVQLFPYMIDAKKPDYHDQLTKERDVALEAVSVLKGLTRPADSKLTQDQFDAEVKKEIATDEAAAGFADLQLKDNAGAVEAFKLTLVSNPNDAVSEYRLGLAYLGLTPPQNLDGFWALARAINLKVPDEGKVKDYLRKEILAYEQPGCDSQVDAQLNELLQLAANAAERPATYTIPSADDLHKISQASNILTVISDLSSGGDKAKMTWLAICGAEFPEVVGKIIDIKQNGDGSADFLVYTGATQDDMQAATTSNMDVKIWIAAPTTPPPAPAGGTAPQITPQPDVMRLQKDDGIRFSGTLVSYDPSPFLLHWDQVKVDPTIIPEKTETGKHPHKVPPKKSSQR
jgi:tetratricopeptide (TPR) repeat protein